MISIIDSDEVFNNFVPRIIEIIFVINGIKRKMNKKQPARHAVSGFNPLSFATITLATSDSGIVVNVTK